jgi:hypothetical protein
METKIAHVHVFHIIYKHIDVRLCLKSIGFGLQLLYLVRAKDVCTCPRIGPELGEPNRRVPPSASFSVLVLLSSKPRDGMLFYAVGQKFNRQSGASVT